MADRLFHTTQFFIWITIGLFVVFSFGAGIRPGYAKSENLFSPTAILVSKHINPYMEAASGLKDYLQDRGGSAQIILLEEMDAFEREKLSKRLLEQSYRAAVAIGPQAARLVWSVQGIQIPIVFSMVLHPHQAVEESGRKLCGISLSIPVDIQLQRIENSLPGRVKIGLLFHPEYNQTFYRRAVKAAKSLHVQVVPLPISGQEDVSQVLDRYLEQVDALWLIPDKGLNSQKVVEFIIKQALYAKVPVVGYNRFFHESGAAVSFIFDYGRIGRQTGRLLMNRITTGKCKVLPAGFEVWENERIFSLLGLERG